MSVGNKNEVKVEKIFKAPVARVFKAISEGRLFFNCGAGSQVSEIDFRTGGKYLARFVSYEISSIGEFLEIIPDKKIVFTWGQEGNFSGTQVTIELFPEGDQTKLVLTHIGFKDRELAESHNGGWTAGLNDLATEMEKGQIRMVRMFNANVDSLYKACSDPARFFGIMGDVSKGQVDFRVGGKYQLPTKENEIRGEFLEIDPGKKIVLTWLAAPCGAKLTRDTRLTLIFDSEEDNGSSLELIHELLDKDETVASHRAGWDCVLAEMKKKLDT